MCSHDDHTKLNNGANDGGQRAVAAAQPDAVTGSEKPPCAATAKKDRGSESETGKVHQNDVQEPKEDQENSSKSLEKRHEDAAISKNAAAIEAAKVFEDLAVIEDTWRSIHRALVQTTSSCNYETARKNKAIAKWRAAQSHICNMVKRNSAQARITTVLQTRVHLRSVILQWKVNSHRPPQLYRRQCKVVVQPQSATPPLSRRDYATHSQMMVTDCNAIEMEAWTARRDRKKIKAKLQNELNTAKESIEQLQQREQMKKACNIALHKRLQDTIKHEVKRAAKHSAQMQRQYDDQQEIVHSAVEQLLMDADKFDKRFVELYQMINDGTDPRESLLDETQQLQSYVHNKINNFSDAYDNCFPE